jgi:hypothetical protein
MGRRSSARGKPVLFIAGPFYCETGRFEAGRFEADEDRAAAGGFVRSDPSSAGIQLRKSAVYFAAMQWRTANSFPA